MFGWFKDRSKKADVKQGLSPEVEAVFRKIDRLMSDEEFQNEQLPEPFRSEVTRGVSCDELTGATGHFGRDPRNAIPVNGPLGELIYLSNLRTTDQTPVLFHRLGSIARVDVFEIVSFTGSVWDILFLDPYHPRKSRRAPAGYEIASSNKGRSQLLFGTNDFVEAFPSQLPDAIANTFERVIGVRMRPPQVRELIERTDFIRPAAHEVAIASFLQAVQRAKAPSSKSTAEPLKRQSRQVGSDETTDRFLSMVGSVLTLQLVPTFPSLREAFSSIMTNKKAAGYVFGFHDALAQRIGVLEPKEPTLGLKLIESSYRKHFGEQAGFALFEMSMHRQNDPDFHRGRMSGANELDEFIDKKTQPMGLSRVLVFHLDS